MKNSTIIIGAILVAFTFLPLLYLLSQTSRKEKKIRKSFERLCDLNKIKVSELTLCGDLILGVDPIQKKVIYSSRKHVSEKFEIIDLRLQTDCKIKSLKVQGKYVEWVGLELVNNTSKKEIVFYQEDEDDAPVTDPNVCLREAEKWHGIIKPLLKAS